MEIVLVILGIVVFIVSFLLPAGKAEDDDDLMDLKEEAVKGMVDKEVQNAREQINGIVDETTTYAMEKTERAMERLTNEKIMAVNEYSDTVLSEINKNHKEVVFLYDMLNDKQENLKTIVTGAVKAESEVRKMMEDAERLSKEAERRAKEVEETLDEVTDSTAKAKRAAASLDKTVVEAAVRTVESVADEKPKEEPEEFRPIAVKRVKVVGGPSMEKADTKNVPSPETEKGDAAPQGAEKKKKTGKNTLPKETGGKAGDLEEAAGGQAGGRKADRQSGKRSEKQAGKQVDKQTGEQDDRQGDDPSDGQAVVEAGRILGMPENAFVPETTVPAVSEEEDSNAAGRNNNEKILELHKAGRSNMAIAKELGLGIGEVKLVIDLFEGA